MLLHYYQVMNIKRPTLLVDSKKCAAKIDLMLRKCTASGVRFRPHFKTHQSRAIGEWFRAAGVEAITVSSVSMAGYFAEAGWKDILIAFPFNPFEIEEMRAITRLSNLTITIPGSESAEILSKVKDLNCSAVIEIDCGYQRSGVRWDDREDLMKSIGLILENNSVKLTGLITHAGNTYTARGDGSVSSVFTESIQRLRYAKELTGISELELSAGDTPSASVLDRFDGINEMRPGNFIFHDLMQLSAGACTLEEISVLAMCPVVDIDRQSGRVIIYGGAVHLSKESLATSSGPVFGLAGMLEDGYWCHPWEDAYLTSLSQEHGIISFPDGIPTGIRPGSLIGVTPVHSCLTADLLAGYLTMDGLRLDHMNANFK